MVLSVPQANLATKEHVWPSAVPPKPCAESPVPTYKQTHYIVAHVTQFVEKANNANKGVAP